MTVAKQIRYVLHKLFVLNGYDMHHHQFVSIVSGIIAQYGITAELNRWAEYVNNQADATNFNRFAATCNQYFNYSKFKM